MLTDRCTDGKQDPYNTLCLKQVRQKGYFQVIHQTRTMLRAHSLNLAARIKTALLQSTFLTIKLF